MSFENWLELIDTIKWPLAFMLGGMFALVLFRAQIKQLLGRVSQARVGNTEWILTDEVINAVAVQNPDHSDTFELTRDALTAQASQVQWQRTGDLTNLLSILWALFIAVHTLPRADNTAAQESIELAQEQAQNLNLGEQITTRLEQINNALSQMSEQGYQPAQARQLRAMILDVIVVLRGLAQHYQRDTGV